ncbi:uncharacterized protein EHS24_001757 [Apiotrichum porosum]|uniref:Glycosyl hydrolase family 13 catalytic domain-containing protein n=1 Tax=Apiotrichum porosum TaxID=105984 RepID=A0A427XJ04_9TREE|nr:uncharacterized protein EHS24_001757 [Apiotrichum porosum]RSH78836.1 hypothetical protein EHS24_001757 [Apiotrichum porosum]
MTVDIIPPASQRRWWKESTVYQIYPASFNDHADSGHGTLPGIIERVPYLQELGVDIIWLSPIYESPQADMGYDISDYQKIDPRYGTLEDWDNLRDACHERGMKLVMDLVVNHSSNEHAWFKESRSSKTNPKRDWYYWRKGSINEKGERVPPNNWEAMWGGSTWEYDEESDEYYLHLFAKQQPDLNWLNPEVREAVYKMMRWWLDRGADGFRMDVINFIDKAPGFPDAPTTNPYTVYQPFGPLSVGRPGVHTHLKEMHEKVLKDYDCFCVGECPGGDDPEAFAQYSKPENNELQMVFNFHHLGFDRARTSTIGRGWNPDWKLSDFKQVVNTWHVDLPKEGGWMSNYVDNHDQPRLLSRIGSDHPDHRARSAQAVAVFHTTLTGTIFVFQGQENGQINMPHSWGEEEYKDIESVEIFEGERERLKREGATQAEIDERIKWVLGNLRETARDNGRTPMQWDSSEHAGFSKGQPWMRVHDDYKQWNVKSQENDKQSVWSFWQAMLALRKKHLAIIYGKFIPLDESSEENYTYIREDEDTGEKLLVVLNLARGPDRTGLPIKVDLASMGVDTSNAQLIIANDGAEVGSGISGPLDLDNWGARVYLLQQGRAVLN